jgi:superfamily I DNA and/or RNA helicase
MIAWMQAIRKIGKGTGKYAERHRATAREELQKCQGAIPAWVMPMHRVVENVKAIPEQFDVAIIDEASQSGPEALILNYIARKVVVVGDDKQIRPQNVGVDRDQVDQLRRTHLSDIEHNQSFDLDSSYFSQAELRFQNQIRLKEHFRCMPEIILFSNNYFYSSDPLVPLRQFGGSRLMPVVKAEHVDGGFVSGRGTHRVNEPEAKRLVELIAECCEDPAYDDKSMGVICLTGGEQEQLIQKLLIDEIEAEEIEARNILVGRPYTVSAKDSAPLQP